ncbi:MAG: biopolymer transporter ExbD [Lewinellaceae bacterium]|nr:biopolymer transporter ExbD [Lewinellaceae bacterium]
MRHRMSHEIAAGAMADIAFLLLIFFMIATKIESDQGLLVQLPPYNDTPPVASGNRKALQVLLNADDQIMVRTIGKIRNDRYHNFGLSALPMACRTRGFNCTAGKSSIYLCRLCWVYDILYRIRNRWRTVGRCIFIIKCGKNAALFNKNSSWKNMVSYFGKGFVFGLVTLCHLVFNWSVCLGQKYAFNGLHKDFDEIPLVEDQITAKGTGSGISDIKKVTWG